jgi:hypothetical protein
MGGEDVMTLFSFFSFFLLSIGMYGMDIIIIIITAWIWNSILLYFIIPNIISCLFTISVPDAMKPVLAIDIVARRPVNDISRHS